MWTSSMMMGVGLPSIGGAYQGGYYIGDIDDGGTIYHLVLAPKASGQSGSLIAYKTTADNDTGTDSTTNGLTNSNAINDASHPAAQFCRGLTIGGFSDWYLPAKDELNVVYTNRSTVSGDNALDVDATYYWSSTESGSNPNQAWVQRFSDGSQSSAGTKNATIFRTRAIRRIAA